MNPSASRESFDALLASAWAQDPTTALRLVFQLGNCRKGGGGKLDRRNFIRGLLWMWRNGQRRTVLLNLEEIHRQGCYKDLLTLVHEAIFDPEYSERNDRAVAEREAARKARGKGKGPLLADVVKREASRSLSLRPSLHPPPSNTATPRGSHRPTHPSRSVRRSRATRSSRSLPYRTGGPSRRSGWPTRALPSGVSMPKPSSCARRGRAP